MLKNGGFVIALWGAIIYTAMADDANCPSIFTENITDISQASIIISLLNNAKDLLEDAKKLATLKPWHTNQERHILNDARFFDDTSKPFCDKPMDCADVQEANSSAESGIYRIWPRSRVLNGHVDVYCDMEDDGGAWTVIQRRGDFDSGEEYFYRDWNAYKRGFGILQKDFWLGNDKIYALTIQRYNVMKVTLRDWDGNETHAHFDEFWIEDETRKYTMHVSGYRGTAGDSFSYHNGAQFSTKDQDNDTFSRSCAVAYTGAWWYYNCHTSNLNGKYLKGTHSSTGMGVNWKNFKDLTYSLKDTVMKVRPKDFNKNQLDTNHSSLV